MLETDHHSEEDALNEITKSLRDGALQGFRKAGVCADECVRCLSAGDRARAVASFAAAWEWYGQGRGLASRLGVGDRDAVYRTVEIPGHTDIASVLATLERCGMDLSR